jgi:hypothetical protein
MWVRERLAPPKPAFSRVGVLLRMRGILKRISQEFLRACGILKLGVVVMKNLVLFPQDSYRACEVSSCEVIPT